MDKIKSILFKNKEKVDVEDSKVQENRTNEFKMFSQKYLKEEFYSLDNSDDVHSLENFSFFVTGSDQVWNSDIYRLLNLFFNICSIK